MKERKGSLQIFGWKAEKQDDQTYLVSYTFDNGDGVIGIYFEVNLVAEIVRNIKGDSELEKKYNFGQ